MLTNVKIEIFSFSLLDAILERLLELGCNIDYLTPHHGGPRGPGAYLFVNSYGSIRLVTATAAGQTMWENSNYREFSVKDLFTYEDSSKKEVSIPEISEESYTLEEWKRIYDDNLDVIQRYYRENNLIRPYLWDSLGNLRDGL